MNGGFELAFLLFVFNPLIHSSKAFFEFLKYFSMICSLGRSKSLGSKNSNFYFDSFCKMPKFVTNLVRQANVFVAIFIEIV